MRGLAVLLGLAPFAMLETGLRWFAPPASEAAAADPFLDLQPLRPLFVLEEHPGRWSIPKERSNYFQPASFAAIKPAGTRRIFVLGGSTVQGRPYSTETAFSTWLKFRLESAATGTDFEVVNCGGVSYASYRVAKILDEVLRHDPDAIVLYTGHNEFLEDRTYGDLRSMSATRKAITRVGSRFHTVRWFQSLLARTPEKLTELSPEVDAKLDHVHGLESYRRDPAWRRGVHSHFADALQRMVQTARNQQIPVILCTPASELVDTPPFKVDPSPTLSESELTRFAANWTTACHATASPFERLEACQSCLAIDPEHAGAHYVAGRLYDQQRTSQLARQHLIAARDHDVCPLRATSSIVDSVHQIAETSSIPLVDTIELFDQRDSEGKRIANGIPDPEFFVDHVHPTIAGHQLIALEIATEFEKLGWIELDEAARQQYESLVAEHLETLREAYYGRGKQRLEGLRRWAAGRAGELGSPFPLRTGVRVDERSTGPPTPR